MITKSINAYHMIYTYTKTHLSGCCMVFKCKSLVAEIMPQILLQPCSECHCLWGECPSMSDIDCSGTTGNCTCCHSTSGIPTCSRVSWDTATTWLGAACSLHCLSGERAIYSGDGVPRCTAHSEDSPELVL